MGKDSSSKMRGVSVVLDPSGREVIEVDVIDEAGVSWQITPWTYRECGHLPLIEDLPPRGRIPPRPTRSPTGPES